jgi:hypothetical protein
MYPFVSRAVGFLQDADAGEFSTLLVTLLVILLFRRTVDSYMVMEMAFEDEVCGNVSSRDGACL